MNIKNIFSAVAAAAMLTACVGDLNTIPLNPTDVTSETAYGADEQGYVQGLTKIYFQLVSNNTQDLQVADGGASEFIRAFWSTQEVTADAAKCAWGDAWVNDLNNNTWKGDVLNDAVYAVYVRTLQGIAYVNEYLRQTSDANLDLRGCSGDVKAKVQQFRAEARFLRAYYYFSLMRMYGPVPILGEECADYTSEELRDIDRNTWDECVEWVCGELDAAAAVLPLTQPDEWLGRATKGAAMAVKARLLLYSARPLYNGNPMYAGIKNYYGKDLFPQTYDPNKWVKAAEAAEDLMDLHLYEIVGENAGTPYDSWKKVFVERWNKEIIFARQSNSYNWRVATTPEGVGGRAYGGVAVTQKLVDAFAMEHGRYSITGYYSDGAPIIDEQSGYSESGFEYLTHPIFKNREETFKMYIGREPRFYMSVFWNNLTWVGGSNKVKITMHRGGNSYSGTSDNYSVTGYLPYKFANPNYDTKNASSTTWEAITWPLFRYAEVLLNYAEAVNEAVNAGVGEYILSDALAQLNRIRRRAGVPNIEEVYADATTYEGLKKYILRERQIELNFENLRYFDTRTNLLSEVEDAGEVYGMNVSATSSSKTGGFWQRTVIPHDGGNNPSTRVFTKRQYLLPYYQSEVDRLNNLTQNPFY